MPATTGGEICVAGLLNALSKNNEVTAFTVTPYKAGFETQVGNTKMVYAMRFNVLRYLNPLQVFKVNKAAKQANADWLLFEQPWLGWMIVWLRVFTKKKFAVRSHNIEYLRFRSLNKWYWQVMYMYEKYVYKSAHMVFFLTEPDRKQAIFEFDLNPEHTFVSPYGVNYAQQPQKASVAKVDELKRELGIEANTKMILFFSTLNYKPNHDAVKFIVDEIHPILQEQITFKYKIVVCGKGLSKKLQAAIAATKEIVYLGFVEDINLYIDAADVMINPILSGGGVKTKVIDTLARNQKVVSTQTGAEGIDLNACNNNLIPVSDENWKGFVKEVIATSSAQAQVNNQFYQTYNWDIIAEKMVTKMSDFW